MPRLARFIVFLAAALVWAVAGGVPAVMAGAVVSDARVGIHPDMTRFVLELSEPIAFQVKVQSDPYRAVLELPEVMWRAQTSADRVVGVVRRFVHNLSDTGASRVVLDLTGPARVREAFLIPAREGHGPRLVVDLEAVGRDRFLAEKAQVVGSRTATASAAAPPPPVNGPTQVAALPAPSSPPPRKLTPARTPPTHTPPVPPAAGKSPVIALDPGHGGVDPGAIGVDGTYEKSITLDVARELKRLLEIGGRYKVVLTRDKDVFVRLRDRVARAREAEADLFISLHADIDPAGDLRGLSIYTLSEKASDREAEMLAQKENRADAIGGINLSVENDEVASILIDLVQRDTMNQSKRFASMALGELGSEVRLLPSKPLRSAGFAVLTGPDLPSALVELGYLSNAADLELLKTENHRQKLARALSRSVDDYFTWLATARR
ncbi:MAG TPA: N-acetylmuramoyl-L-alanine amidase [Azospirillaceae bacterium]|nr:N-acetylmuramoyl-L-alanine amidase [Azospirillaceae bacterium]